MQNRWTMENLEGIDNLTFAMAILSERGAKLNSEAPLAKKLKQAFTTLEELRDICRENRHYAAGIISEKETIYRAVERDNMREDIKAHLGLTEDGDAGDADLSGMTPEAVFADDEIVDSIIGKIDDAEGSEYWDTVEGAIEKGIKEVLETRAEAPGEPV